MPPLSLGKIRCFQQLTNEFGVFAMVAFDHRDVFVDTLSQTLGVEQAAWSVVVAEKERIARALAPHASAVLLDPLYSAGPVLAAGALPGNVSFAVAREKSGYSNTEAGRVTVLLDGWSVEAIKRIGGEAVATLPSGGTNGKASGRCGAAGSHRVQCPRNPLYAGANLLPH